MSEGKVGKKHGISKRGRESVSINSNDYSGYEYKELQLESNKVSLHIDCYFNFGWESDENRSMTVEQQAGKTEKVHVYLKRNRKIVNRAELTQLQRNFEDCLKQIEALETSKTSKALAAAIGSGYWEPCLLPALHLL